MSQPKRRDIVNLTGGVKTEDGRLLYGMDAEVYLKLKQDEDPDYEKQVVEWIEKVTEEPLSHPNDLFASLKNGITLCKMVNKLKPDIIPKYNTKLFRGKLHPLSERENITLYLEACWKIGLSSSDIFVVADLHGRQGMRAVMNNIGALSQFAVNFGCTVPPIGPKKKEVDEAIKRAEEEALNPPPEPEKKPKVDKVRHWEVTPEPQPVFVHQIPESELEEVETELKRTTMKLEETQRLLNRLEMSKSHLDNLLKLEKQKVEEFEKEVLYLRQQRGADASSFSLLDELRKERDSLALSVMQLQKQLEQDEEKMALRLELQELKNKYTTLQQQGGGGSGGAEASEEFQKLRQRLDEETEAKERIEAKLKSLEAQSNAELSSLRKKAEQLEAERKSLIQRHHEESEKLQQQIKLKSQQDSSLLESANEKQLELEGKIKELEAQLAALNLSHERAIADHRAKIDALNAAAMAEAENLRQTIAHLEKEKVESVQEMADSVQEREREFAASKAEASRELARLQMELEMAEREKQRAIQEFESEKAQLTKSLEKAQAKAQKQLNKLREQLAASEAENEKLSAAQQAQRDELEKRIESNRADYARKEKEFTDRIEALLREKRELTEQHFAETQKLSKEKWEREAALQREIEQLRSSAGGSGGATASSAELNALRSEIEALKREKTQLMERYEQQHTQQIQQHMAQQDALERRVLEEKRKKEALEEEIRVQRQKLEQQMQELAKRYDAELAKAKASVKDIETERDAVIAKTNERINDLQSQINKITMQAEADKASFKSQISALELEKSTLASDRDSARAAIQEQVAALQLKSQKQQQKLNEQIQNLMSEKAELTKRVAQLESERSSAVNEATSQNRRFIEEMSALRQTFQSALGVLTTANADLTAQRTALEQEKLDLAAQVKSIEAQKAESERLAAERVENALALKTKAETELAELKPLLSDRQSRIKTLENTMITKEVQYKMDLAQAQRQAKGGEEKRLKQRVMELEAALKASKEYIEKLEKRLEARKKKSTKESDAPKPDGDSKSPRPKLADLTQTLPSSTELSPRHRSRAFTGLVAPPVRGAGALGSSARARRRSIILSPTEINDEMARLRDVVNKIMISEPVPMEELLGFKNLFKIDTGRRFFTFMLKEYSEKAMDGETFLVTSSSFDMLRVLIELVLQHVDLSSGADFISGKILLETSSLIGREVKGSNEPEFLQVVIKPHECWQNTFFWEEYFYAQSTSKFQELFGELSPEGSADMEKVFFEDELIQFVKGMYGWGNMPFPSLALFAESMAEKINLDEPARERVLDQVAKFHEKMTKERRDKRKTRIFQGTSVQARDRRMSVMVGTLEGGQLQRMLEIEARSNANSPGSRSSQKRPVPPTPTTPSSAPSPKPSTPSLGVAPPAGAAASGAGGAVPSPRPRLERQDSARTPGWMAKPRPGSQRPERDDDPNASSSRLNIGVRSGEVTTVPATPAPIPAATAATSSPSPQPIPVMPQSRSRPQAMALNLGSSPIVNVEATPSPDISTSPVSPRKLSKVKAPLPKPQDFEQSRRRIMAKSMVVSSGINSFLDSMIDVYRREAAQEGIAEEPEEDY